MTRHNGHVTRVPAHLVLHLLHAEADRTGDQRYRVTATTLRSWRHRGHLSAGRGYDLGELLRYLDQRELGTRHAAA
jgi:hypothetical protein